jgi:hypothetical protein
MKKIVLFFLSLLPFCSYAQTSLLQDKSGETSILIKDKKSILINAGNTSASASFSLNKRTSFIGTNLNFKSSEGVSSLLDGYKLKPEVELSIFGGKSINPSKKSVIQYIYSGLKINNTYFNLLKKDGSNTFDGKTFYGGSISIGYNRIGSINILSSEGIAPPYLFGISVNYSHINNLDDLKSVQTYSYLTKDTSNTKNILLSDKKSGFSGDYSSFWALGLNLDAYLYPSCKILSGRVGFGGYLRSQLSGTDPRTNAGIGFVVGEKEAPTNIVFGVLYQFNDVFNQLNQENDFIKRGGINIVAGYYF